MHCTQCRALYECRCVLDRASVRPCVSVCPSVRPCVRMINTRACTPTCHQCVCSLVVHKRTKLFSSATGREQRRVRGALLLAGPSFVLATTLCLHCKTLKGIFKRTTAHQTTVDVYAHVYHGTYTCTSSSIAIAQYNRNPHDSTGTRYQARSTCCAS